MIERYNRNGTTVYAASVELRPRSSLPPEMRAHVSSQWDSVDESLLFGVGRFRILVNGVDVRVEVPDPNPGTYAKHLEVVYVIGHDERRVGVATTGPIITVISFDIKYEEDMEAYL